MYTHNIAGPEIDTIYCDAFCSNFRVKFPVPFARAEKTHKSTLLCLITTFLPYTRAHARSIYTRADSDCPSNLMHHGHHSWPATSLLDCSRTPHCLLQFLANNSLRSIRYEQMKTGSSRSCKHGPRGGTVGRVAGDFHGATSKRGLASGHGFRACFRPSKVSYRCIEFGILCIYPLSKILPSLRPCWVVSPFSH